MSPDHPTTIATSEGVRAEHVAVPMPDGEASDARLSFDNGVERLDLSSVDEAGSLLTASFGEPLPVVWASDRNVHVEYPLGSRILRRSRRSRIELSSTVPWALDVHGGASHVDADLADIEVRTVMFHSGAAQIKLVLGRPSGTSVIRLGAVKDLRIERPADVPVRLELAKSAVKLALDDRRIGAISGGLTDFTAGYDEREPHYVVSIGGGADTVTIGGHAG